MAGPGVKYYYTGYSIITPDIELPGVELQLAVGHARVRQVQQPCQHHQHAGGGGQHGSRTNQRPVSNSREHSRPIRGQNPGHVITLGQSAAA